MEHIPNELICSLVTAVISAIVRALEKRKLKKKGLLFDTPPVMNGKQE